MTINPPCCSDTTLIEWLEGNASYGPEKTGWAMQIGEDYGAATYCNVAFCPWCGAKLPDQP